jgi:hypothetical protein
MSNLTGFEADGNQNALPRELPGEIQTRLQVIFVLNMSDTIAGKRV